MSRVRNGRAVARLAAFVALAVALAALFVRLGFWQLDRLAERRTRNGMLAARLGEAVVPFELLKDTTSYRRVVVSGAADHTNEIILTGRSRQGSPGVYVMTPIRRTSNDTAVLVVRGWVYAPDAATADLSRWRESRADFTGYVLALPMSAADGGRPTSNRKLRTLTSAGVQRLLPYPIAALYVVAQDSAAAASIPARLAMPSLDDGPHLSYAIQWFFFAAIAIVGAGIVTYRTRTGRSNGSVDA